VSDALSALKREVERATSTEWTNENLKADLERNAVRILRWLVSEGFEEDCVWTIGGPVRSARRAARAILERMAQVARGE